MNNMKCPVCEFENKNEEGQHLVCLVCGVDLTNSNAETKLMEATTSATFATSDRMSDMRKEGFIYLTDKRLIVIPADIKFVGHGLGGGLAAATAKALHNKMMSDSSVISIPLADIKAVKDGKFGLLVKAIVIETINNEIIKITVPKRNEWKEALAKASK